MTVRLKGTNIAVVLDFFLMDIVEQIKLLTDFKGRLEYQVIRRSGVALLFNGFDRLFHKFPPKQLTVTCRYDFLLYTVLNVKKTKNRFKQNETILRATFDEIEPENMQTQETIQMKRKRFRRKLKNASSLPYP